MHFGPEWMRTKHQPLPRSQHPPSPPPANGTHPGVGLTTLVSGNSAKDDGTHPFRYSKEELVRIYQEGGGKGLLGQDVERWEGVVRSVGADPITLREMTEAEKKVFGMVSFCPALYHIHGCFQLFTGPLNSEVRRRPSQSAEYLSPLATSNLGVSRLNQSPSGSASSPMRERFGGLKRRDSGSHATGESSFVPFSCANCHAQTQGYWDSRASRHFRPSRLLATVIPRPERASATRVALKEFSAMGRHGQPDVAPQIQCRNLRQFRNAMRTVGRRMRKDRAFAKEQTVNHPSRALLRTMNWRSLRRCLLFSDPQTPRVLSRMLDATVSGHRQTTMPRVKQG